MKRNCLIKVSLVVLLCTSMSAQTIAASADYEQGMRAYSARQYSQALGYFSRAASSAPNDPTPHYYMGLCYQGMNQMTQARQQYDWVARYASNPSLRAQAQTALNQLSSYKTSWQSASSQPTAAKSTRTASASAEPAGGKKISGRLQVVLFSTTWCKYCKQFAPIWDQVSGEMRSRADFKHLDGDDPSNENLKQKWGVSGYPTIIFTDNSGQALSKQAGAPGDADSFKDMVTGFLAKHS